jgi:hypothetical protein
MKTKGKRVLGVAVMALIASSAPVFGDTYELTLDHCTGGCNPGISGAPMGTVTLTQNGLNNVLITVTLSSPLELIRTGVGDTINFNILGTPTISLASTSDPHFSLTSSTAGILHFGGFGYFEYGLQLDTRNGVPGAQPSLETFDISCESCNLTPASFATDGAGANVFFGIDTINPTKGTTGPIGGSTPAGSVPEPASVMLLGTALAFTAKILFRPAGRAETPGPDHLDTESFAQNSNFVPNVFSSPRQPRP